MKTNQSKIDQLIQELCPDGVKSKNLSSLGYRNKGTPITASRMKELHQEGSPIRIFAGGKTVADFPADALPEKNIINKPSIIVKSRGHIGFEYYDKPFSHKNELWSYSIDTDGVNQKFVYYYLLTKIKSLQELARATSVKLPQLSVRDTDNLQIPIPPLEVQKEIVKILDTFTQLEAELEAELEARRKQYEFYRNQLLTSNEPAVSKKLTLSDIGKIVTGRTPRRSDEDFWGTEVLFITPSDIKTESKHIVNTSRQLSEKGSSMMSSNFVPAGSILVTCIGSDMGKTVVNSEDCITNQQINAIILNDNISVDYVYHYLAAKAGYLKSLGVANGSTMPIINKSMFSKIEIELPQFAVQKEISNLLDKFDKLVNDISEGLPAELNARRKQYEYYRTKLLTFQEAKE